MSSSPSDLPRLGSLAQSARSKQLRQARNILIVIGLLNLILAVFVMMGARSLVKGNIDREVQQAQAKGMVVDQVKRQEVEDQAVREVQLQAGITMALGAVFVVLGLLINQFPVPATVLALVIYVGANVIFAIQNPASLGLGWWLKIIIVIALVKALQSALAFQREKTREAAAEAGL